MFSVCEIRRPSVWLTCDNTIPGLLQASKMDLTDGCLEDREEYRQNERRTITVCLLALSDPGMHA